MLIHHGRPEECVKKPGWRRFFHTLFRPAL